MWQLLLPLLLVVKQLLMALTTLLPLEEMTLTMLDLT
jgi:hypothetical protein